MTKITLNSRFVHCRLEGAIADFASLASSTMDEEFPGGLPNVGTAMIFFKKIAVVEPLWESLGGSEPPESCAVLDPTQTEMLLKLFKTKEIGPECAENWAVYDLACAAGVKTPMSYFADPYKERDKFVTAYEKSLA